MWVAIATLFLASTPVLGDFAHDPDADVRPFAALPLDVRVHIDRERNCNHWAGEEGYDRARAQEIDRAVRALKCETLDAEDARLRHRYAAAPVVLKALATSHALYR
jgi:hypothetical protein